MLEELAERDLSEVIPMLIEKIKQWEKRKAAQVLLQNACKTWLYKTIYRKKLGGIRTIQHVKRSKAIYLEYKKKHILWLEKRKREEAERKRKEAEERARREEEERRRAEEAAKQAAEDLKNAKDAEERAKAEAAAKAAKAAEEAATAALDSAKAEEVKQAAAANAEQLTEAQIEAQIEAEMREQQRENDKGAVAPPPPAKDTVFVVQLARGDGGLGLDVDHYRKGATIGYVQPDGVAGKDGNIKVGDMIQAVNGKVCNSYDEVINCIRGAGAVVELTLVRKHVSLLLTSKLHMQVGARAEWEEFEFSLFSNRELNFEKTQPPAYNGGIDVRLALEVRVVDALICALLSP